jgi:hypothetical protein
MALKCELKKLRNDFNDVLDKEPDELFDQLIQKL